MRKLLLPLVWLLAVSSAFAQQKITFANTVANIIYNNCTSCHRSGSIAPFTLQNYQDVVNNQSAIAAAVSSKIMPPWSPDPSYTHMVGEKKLTSEQINQILEWVNTGAERGEEAQEPAPPIFNNQSQLLNPQFSSRIHPHTVQHTLDEFAFFSLPSGLNSDAMLQQIELVPGNRKIVHHIFVFLDSTGQFSNSIIGDSINQKGGSSYISGGSLNEIKLIGGWLPGGSYYSVPEGMAFRVPRNSRYIVQIHYAPGSYGLTDSTQLNVKYTSEGIAGNRLMSMRPLLDNSVNLVHQPGPDSNLFIPANTVKSYKEMQPVGVDLSLISITPHQHLLGKRLKVYAVYNGDTVRLVDDRWNFHWQGMYTFPKPVHLRAGSVLYAEGTYDNTINNVDNPNYPPKDVVAGNSTLTEMMQVFFCWVPYQTGDENIVLGQIDENTSVQPAMGSVSNCYVYPNPVVGGNNLNLELLPGALYNLNLYTMDGRLVKDYGQVNVDGHVSIPMPELAKGMYFIKIANSQNVISRKFAVE